MKWPEYQLSQLAESFISGGTPSTKIVEYWNGNIPWITGADFVDGGVVLGRRYINEAAINDSSTNIVPQNSILMVTRTGVGKIALAPCNIAISQDITGIVPKSVIYSKYVLAAIRFRMPSLIAAQRGATVKGITRSDVEKLTVLLPSLSEQRRIVEILDQTDALRKKQADADAKSARILPALFYKMFGNPTINTNGWPVRQLREVADSRLGKMLDAKQQTGEYSRPYLRNANVQWNRFDLKEVFEMDFDQKDRREFRLKKGDLLVCEGGEVGRCAIWNDELAECYFQKALHRVRPKQGESTSEYLLFLLQSLALRGGLRESTSQLTIAHLTGIKLKHMKILVPPFKLQKRFGDLVQSQVSNWENINKRKRQLETLFETILNRAFAGDLTAKWREAHMKELLQEMEQQAEALGIGI